VLSLAASVAASFGGLGCGKSKSAPAPEKSSQTSSTTSASSSSGDNAQGVLFDVAHDFSRCVLGHHGVLLDFGDEGLAPSFGLRADPNARETVEREGATWVRARERRLTLTFLSPVEIAAGDAGLVVEAHVRGVGAKTMAIALNGKAAAALSLDKTKATVASARATGVQVNEGQNEITLSFGGRGAGDKDVLAEIDWIHIGPAGDDASYAAPTRADVLGNATVGGVAKPTISLRGPGSIACTFFAPATARFATGLSVTKGGEADVELHVHRDRATTETLGTWHLAGDDANAWKQVTAELPSYTAPVEMEIAVTKSSKGARVLLGEPRVARETSAEAPAPAPHAENVVLVVLGDVSPRTVAAFGGRLALPEIDALAKRGFAFDAHRSQTTLSSGALASMLSGLSPRDHGVSDPSARLPQRVTTVADAARQAGIDTAMFTANPLTGRAFGFDRGFATFVAHSPAEDAPATAVFDDAAKFIEGKKDGRFLVVVHARGAHPPWDVTPDDLKDLPPANYTGGLEPRHAGELMSKARRVPPVLRFQDADRARAWALADVALVAHDKALGRLAAAIKSTGHDANTAIFVTADLAADENAHVPFGDADNLDEQLLSVPLVVVPPGGAPASKRLHAPTMTSDVAVSILASLGLAPPSQFAGKSLWTLANSVDEDEGRGRLAVLGPRFSGRIGPFVMLGSDAREARLCSLELEPTCATDVRATHPIATEALHTFLYQSLGTKDKPENREPATLDPDTAAALRVWGL
jgi:arylsulfatase A-like enzyme